MMTFKRLKNLARKIINAKTYEQRAQIMRAYAYRTGKVKKRGTYGYYFMKLARVFDYYSKNNTGNSPDLFSIFSGKNTNCLLYTSPSPRDRTRSRMPSSA